MRVGVRAHTRVYMRAQMPDRPQSHLMHKEYVDNSQRTLPLKLFRIAKRRKHTRPRALEPNLERYSSLEVLPSTTAGIADLSHSLRLITPSLHTPIQIHTCCTPSYRIKGHCTLPERTWWPQNGQRVTFCRRTLFSLSIALSHAPSLPPSSPNPSQSTHLLRSSALNIILISFSEKPRFLSPDTI